MGVGVVQGVDGGPTTVLVAAFGGVQALQEGPLATCLDFGGEVDEAEEGSGPADGAFAETGGRGHTALSTGGADERPAVAAGAKVGARGVVEGHHKDSAQRDTATGGGHELVAHQQVMPAVDPLDMG